MLILQYVHQDKRVEVPFDLSKFEGSDDPSLILDWDLLNFAASEINSSPIILTPLYTSGSEDIMKTAYDFGFTALVLRDTEKSDAVVFVI